MRFFCTLIINRKSGLKAAMKSLEISSIILLSYFFVSSSEAKSIDNAVAVDATSDNIATEKYANENVEYEDEVVTGRESSEEISVTEANIESRFGEGERYYPELGDGFEGDIILTKEQQQRMSSNNSQPKSEALNSRKLWPTNAKGQATVPYIIAPEYCKLITNATCTTI